MDAVRIGIVGLGHLGALHARMLSDAARARLVAVYDIDAAKAARVAADCGTVAAPDLDTLLDAVDAVSVATPTTTHHAVAMRAIARGRHVFIEKPIAQTVDEAREINAAADGAGVLVQVGHIERFNPAIVALDAYDIAPLFVESHRLAPFQPRGADVPVVHDLMIHDLDLILALVRSDVARIDASGVAVVSPSADIANARLVFENGCVANVTASRISQSRMRKMRLFQRDAYISIDFLQGKSDVFRLLGPAETAAPTALLGMIEQGAVKRSIAFEQPPVPADHNPLRHELTLFTDAVASGSAPVVDGRAAQRALEVAERIVRLIDA